MPLFRLTRDPTRWPDPALAEPSGLLAVGGDLSPARLLSAYAAGIFPWFDDRQPILWWSPDPRMVLFPDELHLSRSLRKRQRGSPYELRFDTDFSGVIRACATAPRPGQRGTWITAEMIAAYERLHALGYAHSAEAWQGGVLVGGLYGVALGGAFFGESMFAQAPDASKLAFVHLVDHLRARGGRLIDCQVETAHLARFGAREIPRAEFLRRLREALAVPAAPGSWAS